jgi:predicted Zn-dependent peptidase
MKMVYTEEYLQHYKTVMDHGLRVVTTPMPYTRSASISLFVGTGSRYESPEIAGISHFVEHMLFKGTVHRPSPKEISEAIEGVGGILNAATDKELTVYWCKVPSRYLDLAMDVLSDNIRNSRLDLQDIDKERKVILEEINMVIDSPTDLVSLMIDEVVWPNQPLGGDTAGTKESVASIGRPELTAFMASHYGPGNAVLAVAGCVTKEQVEAAAAKYLGDWPASSPTPWFPANDGQDGPRVSLKTKRTEQANLCVAVPGYHSDHPDRYTQDVMNTLLGDGMSSRLFLELRERLGLAYDVHSYVNHFKDTGSLVVYAGVDTSKVNQTVQAILNELAKLRDGVSEEELTRTKESMKGRLLLRLEDTSRVSSWTGAQELLRNSIMTVEDAVALIDSVTNDDLRRVAREIFVRDKLNLAIVGPYRSEDRFRNLLNF